MFDLFEASKRFIFLVGAGVSRNSPSCLPSAQDIIKYLILNCAPKGKFNNLKGIRYELIVEYFQRYFDKDLKFFDLFEENQPPNLIHFFLANAVINGHDIVTTNFDYLIEKALLKIWGEKINIATKNVKIIITKDDFIKVKENHLLNDQSLRFLFKIHGSKQNIFKKESTNETVITNISSLVQGKDLSNLFEFENYKKDILQELFADRILIAMGYSGSDEFDISPLLRLFPQLNYLIWVAHSNESNSLIYKINPLGDSINTKMDDDKLLIDISNSVWYSVFKLEINTEFLCKELWNLFLPNVKIPVISKEVQFDLESWFSAKYSDINEFSKYNWIIQLLIDTGRYNDALDIVLQGYSLIKKVKSTIWENLFCDHITLLYIKLERFKEAALFLMPFHNISEPY